jgi:hypothetical protein
MYLENKEILVGVSTTKTFLAWCIRTITREKASHSWLSYWDETLNQRMVIDAQSKGIIIKPWGRWVKQEKKK